MPTKKRALQRVAQVLAASAGERARGVRAVSREKVPRSPQEVGAEWLTAVLCKDTPQAEVRSVTAPAASAGTTTRSSLELTYNAAGVAAGLPTRLFVKCTTTVAQRLMLGLGGLIHGEPGFYTHIRPTLAIEAPVGYFATVDARSWRSLVLTEDVASTRGARFWEHSTTIGREQIGDLLANAAAWHGVLWDSGRLAACRWLKTPAEQVRVIDALLALADRTRIGAERARTVIPSALRARQGELFDGMRRSMQILSQGERTYLHGDLHIANSYCTREGRMGVCDWQVGLKGSWAHDYAYLLATGLEVEDRRRWERDLLDLYLECLAASGGKAIRRDAAWTAYRQALLYPYFAWVYTIGRSRLQPSFQPEQTSLMMIERIATAIHDLDSLGAVGL